MSRTGTIQGREDFLQNIAGRLGREEVPQAAPERTVIGVPEFYSAVSLTKEEKIELFVQNWTALGGKILVCKETDATEAIRGFLKEALVEHGVTRITRWEHEQLAALGLDDWLARQGVQVVPWRPLTDEEAAVLSRQADGAATGTDNPVGQGPNWQTRSDLLRAAEKAQMGIVCPDYAIANTSTLALLAYGGRGRSVSLVTGILFAIFRSDQLVTRMGEAFDAIKRQYGGGVLPSSLNFITGPSRSADIENDLTIGIHGPGKVYAVIID